MKNFLIYLVVSVLAIEVTGSILSAFNIEPTGFKQYFSSEWRDPVNPYADRDSLVGVWHRPNDSWLQLGACFSVPMRSNSFGARDDEWNVKEPGYLFLGSSFVEGHGVAEEKRFTEVFEKLSGKKVFNCGMGGTFTPVQYFYTLKKFAPVLDFDTCFVLIILPNDERGMRKIHKNRYRPYLTDNGIAYTTGKSGFPENKSFTAKMKLLLFQYSYTHHLLDHFKHRNHLKAQMLDVRDDSTARKYPNTEKIMTMFSEEYPDKHFYFVIAPSLEYEPGDFSGMKKQNIQIIDLGKVLNDKTDFLNCNPHWNNQGHDKVGKALYKKVFGPK
jgi:hypothetical protein